MTGKPKRVSRTPAPARPEPVALVKRAVEPTQDDDTAGRLMAIARPTLSREAAARGYPSPALLAAHLLVIIGGDPALIDGILDGEGPDEAVRRAGQGRP